MCLGGAHLGGEGTSTSWVPCKGTPRITDSRLSCSKPCSRWDEGSNKNEQWKRGFATTNQSAFQQIAACGFWPIGQDTVLNACPMPVDILLNQHEVSVAGVVPRYGLSKFLMHADGQQQLTMGRTDSQKPREACISWELITFGQNFW